VASLLVGPAFASSEVDEELAEMRELVEGLKQRVEAQEEQIEHQGSLLDQAQKVVRDQQKEESALSGIAEFWQAIDVNMSVAGSYAYNFHNPTPFEGGSGAGINAGRSGLFYPFHPDHNSFQVDQVWFDIGKAPTEESRAGFQATILYGNTAAFLGQGGNFNDTVFDCPTCPPGSADLDGDGLPDVGLTGGGTTIVLPGSVDVRRRAHFDSTSDFYVHQAYVSYLAPLGEGMKVDFGKFATLIGFETADASKNYNITRGNVYNLLQPIDHVGVLASTTAGPVSFAGGVVNQGNLFTSSPDINSEKSYLGKIGFGTDMFSVATSVLYGAEAVFEHANSDRQGLLDLVATFNSDAFTAWVNADYVWVEDARAAAWGVSLGSMVPLTEVLSAALRLEYVRDKDDFFGILGPRHSEVYGATGTLAYEIVENLTLKGEVRWDRVVEDDGGGTDEFFTNTGGGDNDQVVGLAQVVYAF
jgi:hypothetical protein